LGRAFGVLWNGVLSLDLAETGPQIDRVADLPRLWNVKFYAHNYCQAGLVAPFTFRAPVAGDSHRNPASPMGYLSTKGREGATLIRHFTFLLQDHDAVSIIEPAG
jgi:hypothetical protein